MSRETVRWAPFELLGNKATKQCCSGATWAYLSMGLRLLPFVAAAIWRHTTLILHRT